MSVTSIKVKNAPVAMNVKEIGNPNYRVARRNLIKQDEQGYLEDQKLSSIIVRISKVMVRDF